MDEPEVPEGGGHEDEAEVERLRRMVDADQAERMARMEAEAVEHAAREARLVERVLEATEPDVVDWVFGKGTLLMDVIEETLDADPGEWVRLPRGYATVGFLRQVYALGGAG